MDKNIENKFDYFIARDNLKNAIDFLEDNEIIYYTEGMSKQLKYALEYILQEFRNAL